MMLPPSWPMPRRGRLRGLPHGLSLLGLQAAEEFLHHPALWRGLVLGLAILLAVVPLVVPLVVRPLVP